MSKPLHEVLAPLGKGKLSEVGGELLAEIVARLHQYGGTGSLTIKLDFEAKGGQVGIECSFKTRKPYEPIPTSAYWTTADGDLADEDPDQQVIKFPRGKGKGEPH